MTIRITMHIPYFMVGRNSWMIGSSVESSFEMVIDEKARQGMQKKSGATLLKSETGN